MIEHTDDPDFVKETHKLVAQIGPRLAQSAGFMAFFVDRHGAVVEAGIGPRDMLIQAFRYTIQQPGPIGDIIREAMQEEEE